MLDRLHGLTRRVQWKIHLLALGMTLGLGTAFLNQGCLAAGQCATCGACALRPSILVVPLLADGVVMLVGRAIRALGRTRNRQSRAGATAHVCVRTGDQFD